MTVLEVAEALGKGPRTIQRLAERGELPYEDKLPGRTGPYLFNRAVVELFAQQEQRKGVA